MTRRSRRRAFAALRTSIPTCLTTPPARGPTLRALARAGRLPVAAAAIAALSVAGCGAPGEVGSEARAGTSLNGTSLNGTSLNGTSLNGTSLNGTSLNGTSLNGTGLNAPVVGGVALSGVSLAATLFQGMGSDGRVRSGSDFVGAVFQGALSSGASLPMRIDSMVAGSGANADLFMYGVSYQGSGGWSPLCGMEADGSGPVRAIPINGVWDYGSDVPTGGAYTPDPARFTFACRHTAIAKCVELGYKPWRAGSSGASLQPDLVSCTRLLRADYCGNGHSYTVNGRPIDLYDAVGVQSDTQPGWIFEAEWTPAGASCLSSQRVTELSAQLGGISLLPSCILAKQDLFCGAASHFSSGTLLMNRYEQVDIKAAIGPVGVGLTL